jgi:putative peptide zinc metalloprotease protein
MTALTLAPAGPSLPALRQELRMTPGAPLVSGAPSWILFDPLRHLFFQLGRIEFAIFSHWAAGSFEGITDTLARAGLAEEDVDASVGRVVEFSLANQLTVTPLGDSVSTFTHQRAATRKAWWKWMVDNYLFFRIPLVRPAVFLERTLPRVAPLWSPVMLWAFMLLALCGLFLVSRQWDAFMASFTYFFSWQGLVAYGFGLCAVKIGHELGHAYTATRFGCRVPTMGVSFLVMFPVLYTDTSDAWRLTARKQRLAIDIAGVTAELMIASIATLIWVMLPEGPLRSVVFVLATSSWIMSLSINLNPFMRFDGYYVLSDLLDVPNLQPRAFALGRWKMRELLFNLGDAPPEDMPTQLRRGLIVYAWITWIYRLILFTGIAILVYHMFFKLLGIVLFLVEIGVFLARPILAELRIWADRRGSILGSRRGIFGVAGLFCLALLAILPMDRHVRAPAVLTPIGASPIVAGDPALITHVFVTNGQSVKAGAILFELAAPELDADRGQRSVRIADLEARLARAASDKMDLANSSVLEGELSTQRAAAQGLDRRRDRLVLRAPIDGVVADLNPDIHVGRWIGGAEALARILTPGRYDVQAYVDEDDAWRVGRAARATFVPNDPVQPSRPAKVVERAAAALQVLDQPILASSNGGPIAVNADESKHLRPRAALYRMRLVAQVDRAPPNGLLQPVAGEVVIRAQATSWVDGLLRLFARGLRREASVT